MKLYLVDEGMLLSERDPEFEHYNTVYDQKHGYFDENQYYESTSENAIFAACFYVFQGKPGTYAVVTVQDGFDDSVVENISEISVENADYSVENIIFSICKDESGKILFPFISSTDNKKGVDSI